MSDEVCGETITLVDCTQCIPKITKHYHGWSTKCEKCLIVQYYVLRLSAINKFSKAYLLEDTKQIKHIVLYSVFNIFYWLFRYLPII